MSEEPKDVEYDRMYVRELPDGEWREISTVKGESLTFDAVVIFEGEHRGMPLQISADDPSEPGRFYSTLPPADLSAYFTEMFQEIARIAAQFDSAYSAMVGRMADGDMWSGFNDFGPGVDMGVLPLAPVYTPREKVADVPAGEGGKAEQDIPEEIRAELVNPKPTLRHDEVIRQGPVDCLFCGKRAKVILPISGVEMYRAGVFAQDAMPDVPMEYREVLISGTHPACWDTHMRDIEDDEDDEDDEDEEQCEGCGRPFVPTEEMEKLLCPTCKRARR